MLIVSQGSGTLLCCLDDSLIIFQAFKLGQQTLSRELPWEATLRKAGGMGMFGQVIFFAGF